MERTKNKGPDCGQQIWHRNSDDAHWVFTLSGLISGPYYGRYLFLLWFQRHRFQLGGCGAGLYTLGFHIKVQKLMENNNSRLLNQNIRVQVAICLYDCRVVAHRTRQGSHVQRAKCTVLRPSVRLSVCRSLLGAYRPNPCSQLWVNMYNMHWVRTYNKDRNCFASFPSPRKYTRHRSY